MINTLFLELENDQQPIAKIAEVVISCLGRVATVDKAFRTAYFLYKKGNVAFDINNREKAVEELASHILKNSLNDIQKFDGIPTPDINYSRPYGFTFGILFKEEGRKILSLTFKLGSNVKNTIGILSIAKELKRDFPWYKSLIDSFVQTGMVDYACVRPDDVSFLETSIKSYKAGLGWITFFSKDYEIDIPDDLEGIEYEFTDNGKYLFLTRLDFAMDKEVYQVQKQKLLKVMEEIKRRVPNYAK